MNLKLIPDSDSLMFQKNNLQSLCCSGSDFPDNCEMLLSEPYSKLYSLSQSPQTPASNSVELMVAAATRKGSDVHVRKQP